MKQLVRVFQQFTSFEGNVFRYSLAFSLLLAFAPGIIFCVAIFMAFYLDPLIIIEYGTRFLPKDYLIPFVEYVLESSSFSLGFIITTLIALWLASKSIYSFLLINAKVERIPYPNWSIRLRSLGVFLILIFYIVIVVYAMSLLTYYFPLLLPFASILAILIGFVMFYRSISFEKKEWIYGWIGGSFASVAICGIAVALFYIIDNFTRTSIIYGPLASFVVLLISIYVISSVIYLGFLLNIAFEKGEASGRYKGAWFYRPCMRLHQRLVGFVGRISGKD